MSRANRKFDLEKFFVALSDHNRLRVINLMGEDEVCVCFFVEILKMPQPRVSRRLAYLRRAGIVGARREGKWMHYRIVPPPDERAARIFQEVSILPAIAKCGRTECASSGFAARLRSQYRCRALPAPRAYWFD